MQILKLINIESICVYTTNLSRVVESSTTLMQLRSGVREKWFLPK